MRRAPLVERAAERRLVGRARTPRPTSATRRARTSAASGASVPDATAGSAGRGGSARPKGSSARRRRAGPQTLSRSSCVTIAAATPRGAAATANDAPPVLVWPPGIGRRAATRPVDERVRAPRLGTTRAPSVHLQLHRRRARRPDAPARRERGAQAPSELRPARPAHSYWSASSTFSRDGAARREDRRDDAERRSSAIAKTISWPTGSENDDEVDARDEQRAEHDPEQDPERAADQRGDHALVPDHAPHLPPGHADRAQHPELARALEHRQHERVHDPEQADDDREREQDVEQVQDRVEAGDLVVDELLLGLHLRVRERRRAAARARPCSRPSRRRCMRTNE